MAEDARPRWPRLLIVAGSTLRAEEVDRPLAYYLKQQIESRDVEGTRPALVIADVRWLHDEALQALPTISVGGPGVNLLAHKWLEDLPVSLAVDEQYYIQMDPDLDEIRASIWGMDNETTQIAVSAFLQRYLPRFLSRCASAPDLSPPDSDSDSDDEDDEEDEDE